jgi:hypothetical protein
MWECDIEMRKLLIYILILFSFICCRVAEAQQMMHFDSSNMEVRRLPVSKIKSYSKQKEFDYREQNARAMSIWDRFWSWFWEQFYRMGQNKSVQKSFEIFIWIFSVSLILFAIYRLTGMDRNFFFQGNSQGRPLKYSEEQEDIHAIDFSQAIQDAIDRHQYRIAIRLMYLKNIKILSDRNLIQFRPNKTNTEYTRELQSTSYARGFEDITLVYEYAWYGEFPVGRETFERLRNIFFEYEKSIRL